jgi:hypothetical protein
VSIFSELPDAEEAEIVRLNTLQIEERRFNVEFQGYCVKCREKRTIKEGTVGQTAKGRPMVKGSCPVCGTTVTRFLSDKESSK